MKMIATRDMTYATRRLRAGDGFDTKRDVDAKILQAAKRAKPAPAEPVDPMPALRAEYEAKLGKRPFMGWDADTLRAKIAEATKI